MIDNILVFNPYHTAGLLSGLNPDALSTVTLSSAAPPPGDPGALSGTVIAETRAPGVRLETQGAMSTTHTRLTLDGPLGIGDEQFLVSIRTGFPSLTAPRHEQSYLRGGTGDRIVKLATPAFGGRLRVLRYDSEIEVNTAAVVDSAPKPDASTPRNSFNWSSRSMGAEWTRAGTIEDNGRLARRAQPHGSPNFRASCMRDRVLSSNGNRIAVSRLPAVTRGSINSHSRSEIRNR